jgi:hypothetical protein
MAGGDKRVEKVPEFRKKAGRTEMRKKHARIVENGSKKNPWSSRCPLAER